MKNKITTIIKTTLLLGTIAVALNILFGQNTIIFVYRERIGETALTWYKYDFHSYFNNLYTQITNTTMLKLQVPTWYNTSTGDWIIDLVNGATNTLNGIIMIVNILLYPLKIGGYIVNFILAIIGLNVGAESDLKWLGDMAKTLIALTIGYL